ncbi:MAG: helix-turn-helix domain-containing protein [Saprospiraceae bacterium]|nr:helix-turn-helix domain-containing protein [Saprospiraceae bacterium]MCB0574351.1 helix-turn-helix domain-containing protein [Saprospiraceae bacterium]MCB9306089.1 helix-turn-helix domain-containing protein [Lewinellaceae bacterium]MCB9356219.1 helix-turn-helix domain-containing protein [Lewinellaceae bacterium]
MPTYSICNLLGADRCMTEIVVMRLRHFLDHHGDIRFPHRHNFYQIVLFTEGGGRHSIDFQRFDVRPHEVYYMAPGQIHTWEFDDKTDGFLINFNESFLTSAHHNPHFVRDFPLFNTISGSPVNTLDLACCGELAQVFRQMLEEFDKGGEFSQEILRGMLTIILAKLSRAAPSPFRENASRHHLELIRQFEKLIERHFREKRLPREYAEMMYITPNHLNALTNQVLGKSAGEMIRERVLLEAKRLLSNSDLMVGQIAESLHFEDYAYFTRFFKKYLGATPEGFRALQAQPMAS